MKHITLIAVIFVLLSACSADDAAETPPAPLLGTHYGLAVAEGLPDGDLARVDAMTRDSLFALPDGATRGWQNTESGSSGSVSIMSSTTRGDGTRCRLFAQQFYFEGRIEKALGEACLDGKKNWILQSKSPG